jgi:hypothetical protein
MARVRIAPIKKKKRAAGTARRYRTVVQTKRVRVPDGKEATLFVVDSNDDNFDDELTHVFRLNIDSARQANTAIFGSPDGPVKLPGKAQRSGQKSK